MKQNVENEFNKHLDQTINEIRSFQKLCDDNDMKIVAKEKEFMVDGEKYFLEVKVGNLRGKK